MTDLTRASNSPETEDGPLTTAPVPAPAEVRRIGWADVKDAIARGRADFMAKPSHVVFLAALYPALGLFIMIAVFNYPLVPLLYPLAAGFALLGPVAGLGLYEISRRREQGRDTIYLDAFGVFGSAQFGSITLVALLLAAIFAVWIFVANLIFTAIVGDAPETVLGFFGQVLTTPEGWALIVVGNAVGFLFAALAFSLSVVSLPMLLDRPVDAPKAVATSLKAVAKNPGVMAAYGATIAVGTFLASIPFLIGLAVVLPIFGHATWHLYKKVVV